MTPARKAALQWLHDRGEVDNIRNAPFSGEMFQRMIKEGQVQWVNSGKPIFSLTDKGRRALHGDDVEASA